MSNRGGAEGTHLRGGKEQTLEFADLGTGLGGPSRNGCCLTAQVRWYFSQVWLCEDGSCTGMQWRV